MKKLNIKGVLRRKSRTAGDSAAAASELSSADYASSADSVGGSMRSSVSGSMRSGTPAHTPSRKASASSAMSSAARSASTVNTGNVSTAEAQTNNGRRTSAKADVSASLLPSMPPPPGNRTPPSPARRSSSERITPIGMHDGPEIDLAYETQVPLLEIVELPRGGVSVETQAVGHVQFGIPPETIKDSMRLGIAVPSVYIVPVDRFCREMGPALGVNLAEFEFPAYFNFFVQRKRCTLIVDSVDAERNIRRVFSETLLGPAQFRRGEGSLTHEEEGE